MEYPRFVITGEVDHGKSTLIGRMLLDTGSLPEGKAAAQLAHITDQFREEREQNKTIDTTQIFLKVKKRNYLIIDTPGHIEFIKNMLTGASCAEAAIIIIDVTSGITQQSLRHAYLIKMLGINRVIAAFNKMDLIGFKADEFYKLSRKFMEFSGRIGLFFSHIVPISAKEGVNISKKSSKMPWYDGPSLIGALDLLRLDRTKISGPLRLPVQDIYEYGNERVIVGRLESGNIRAGQHVLIFPQNKEAIVSHIKVFGRPYKRKALRGENIGIILEKGSSVVRGDVIADRKDPALPVSRFKGNLYWMNDDPLRVNEKFVLRCSTQAVQCAAETIEQIFDPATLKIIARNSRKLGLNQAASVTFQTQTPIVVEELSFVEGLGRFVIEGQGELRGLGVIS